MKRYHYQTVCANCKREYGNHRHIDDLCPPDDKKPLGPKDENDDSRWEDRMDDWWAKSSTYFEPAHGE